jgi:hypothetical protein
MPSNFFWRWADWFAFPFRSIYVMQYQGQVMVASGRAAMNFLPCPREERMPCMNYPRGYVYTCALLVHAQSVHKRTQKYWYLLVIFLGKSMLLAKGATNSNPLWKFSFVSKTRPQLWPTLKLFGREPGPRFVYWLQF